MKVLSVDFFYNIYINIVTFLEQGGNVLFLIGLMIFIMWSLICERYLYFKNEHNQIVKKSIEQWQARQERSSWNAFQIRLLLVSQANESIGANMAIIIACVALCPLLGLLGTVTGMIAVFDSMATQGGNARSMAAGVSMATIPTMAGMVGALSGLLGTTYLQRKTNREAEHFEGQLTLEH